MKLNIQAIDHPLAKRSDIKLAMARLDNFQPLASGNKFFKLQANFNFAHKNGIHQLISFGGAFSNHIHALALFGQQSGFKTLGIIRGEPENADTYSQNPTLLDAQKAGMELHFVNRKEYRLRHDYSYLKKLQQQYPKALIIPEGGSNQFAVSGCADITRKINQISQDDIITVACGTGATLAGIACGLNDKQQAIGYSVLHDESMTQRIRVFIRENNVSLDDLGNNISNVSDNPDAFNCDLNCDLDKDKDNWVVERADFGGYAKVDKDILSFIFDWLAQTGILLDPIYTSKMCMRLMQQIEAGVFAPETSICMVHSGGLQGWRGMENKVIQLVGRSQWNRVEDHLS